MKIFSKVEEDQKLLLTTTDLFLVFRSRRQTEWSQALILALETISSGELFSYFWFLLNIYIYIYIYVDLNYFP
ncbi:hypothetical protein CsatB_024074 [Cannabis sativa]